MKTTKETMDVIAMGIQRSSNPCMDCPLVESLAADAADSIERVFDYMEICSCAGDPIYERFLELFFDQFEDTHVLQCFTGFNVGATDPKPN